MGYIKKKAGISSKIKNKYVTNEVTLMVTPPIIKKGKVYKGFKYEPFEVVENVTFEF